MTESEPTPHLLDHPEVQAVFESVNDLLAESDRGATLLCAEHVNDQLGDLFRKIAPSSLGKRELKQLLRFPGALGSFSARQTIAVLCGLIRPQLGDAIGNLRGLRNKAAHGRATFALRNHDEQVRMIYALGQDVPAGINHMANELLLRSALDRMMDAKLDRGDGERPIFHQPSEALDWVRSHPGALAPLEERLPRLELGIATAMICGLIIMHRDRKLDRPAGAP